MHALTATELLGAWERCLSQSAARRPVTLLSLSDGDTTGERVAQLSIGQRDAALLSLRERAFGPRMNGLATCPTCGLEVQLDFTVSDVRVADSPATSALHELNLDDCAVTFRLPNTLDLEALDAQADASATRRALLERCLVSARHRGREMPADQLPQDLVTAISERMSAVDPQAEVDLALRCPQCDQHWGAPLDIASFLWTELHAWALRLLRDVHELASAYGWPEAEILALTPARRQAYLELIER